MTEIPTLKICWSRVAALFRRNRLEGELREEVSFHLDMLAADQARDGLSSAEARAGARRAFGNVSVVQEDMRDGWSLGGLDAWRRDTRQALRAISRTPGFAFVAIATLALGIGANTAILSVIDAVLVTPLPYAQPERLVMIWEDASRIGFARNTPAPGNYVSWRDSNRSFSDIAATRGAAANLTADGLPEQLLGRRVTANFFTVLGVSPILGRAFTEEEDRLNAPVSVISYGLWQRRYAGRRDIVGATLTMNGERRTIIGVMPASFMFRTRDIDFWNPMAFTPADLTLRTSHFLNVVGRLATGQTIESARADIRTISDRLRREYPQSNSETGGVVEPLKDDLLGSTSLQLLVLLGGAGCVLLIACANMASLLLARALSRRGELAVRVSLGATRLAIVRQLVLEAMVLSLAGGLAGTLLAPATSRLLADVVPATMPLLAEPALNLPMLGVAMLLAVATGLLFSLLPALHAAREATGEVLHQSGRSGMGGRSRSRDVLVVGQVAAAVILLVGAGLLLRTFEQLQKIELGFNPQRLITMRTQLPNPKYADPTTRLAFYERVVDQVMDLPGVERAAFASLVPFMSPGNTTSYQVEGQIATDVPDALFRASTHEYLETVGAQPVDGRLLDRRDTQDAPAVVVINETFARLHWPEQRAVGRRVAFGTDAASRTVVGVIKDMRERGYEQGVKPAAYVPFAQVRTAWFPDNLVVRASVDAATLAPAIRQVIASIDPEQPVAAVRMVRDLVDLDVVDRRQQTVLLAAFAALAVLLAALGLYGVLAHAVAQRRREIALRMALGASLKSVVGAVTIQGQLLMVAGLGIGLVLAMAAAQTLRTLLFGVAATDPLTFVVAAALLWAVSLIASGIPALRAARIDPALMLRDE